MLKIRDFARLAEVSMTTLRYYDEIGLLKPIHVDPETGYRFYTIVGPRRKIFLRRGEHLDDALTEIQFPVEKVV